MSWAPSRSHWMGVVVCLEHPPVRTGGGGGGRPFQWGVAAAGWRRGGVLSGRGSEAEGVGEGADGVKSLGCPFFFG